MTVLAFPQPVNPSVAPTLQKDSITLDWPLGGTGAAATYRNGKLYAVSQLQASPFVADKTPARQCVRLTRIPVEKTSATTINAMSGKLSDFCFGENSPDDDPGDLISYELPAVAVTKKNDIAMCTEEFGVNTQLQHEARYSVWYHNEAARRTSGLLQPGNFNIPKTVHTDQNGDPESKASLTHFYDPNQLDFAWAIVDPTDDSTVWMIHAYADSTLKRLKAVIGKVKP